MFPGMVRSYSTTNKLRVACDSRENEFIQVTQSHESMLATAVEEKQIVLLFSKVKCGVKELMQAVYGRSRTKEDRGCIGTFLQSLQSDFN